MNIILKAGVCLAIVAVLTPNWPTVLAFEPQTLDEVILSQSFDTVDNGGLPLGWSQVDFDHGNSPAGPPFYGGRTVWQGLQRTGFSTHTGAGTAANMCNANGAANDDWLVLPRFDTLVAPITFSYWVSSHDAANLESFEVRVSTTDSLPAEFTHLLRSVSATPHMWTQYSDNLSEFAGAPFYVAIHYNSQDKYVIKVDDVQLTAARPNTAGETRIPLAFNFAGNFPNPFNSNTEFHFDLPRAAPVTLILYDVLGREVARPVEGQLTAGSHSVPFSAVGLPSGIYLARLTQSDGLSQCRKVILLK